MTLKNSLEPLLTSRYWFFSSHSVFASLVICENMNLTVVNLQVVLEAREMLFSFSKCQTHLVNLKSPPGGLTDNSNWNITPQILCFYSVPISRPFPAANLLLLHLPLFRYMVSSPTADCPGMVLIPQQILYILFYNYFSNMSAFLLHLSFHTLINALLPLGWNHKSASDLFSSFACPHLLHSSPLQPEWSFKNMNESYNFPA